MLKKENTQRYRCTKCKRTCSDAKNRKFGTLRTKPDKIILVVKLLTEGSSIRAASRVSNVKRDTVTRILRFSGERSEKLLKEKLIDIEASHVECDEIWTFVQQKQKTHIDPEIDTGWTGDYYTFLGMESETKLLFKPVVGKRTELNTKLFMKSLAHSVKGRTQVTTDGFPAYRDAVSEAFGSNVDFAQYYKEYNMLKKRKTNARLIAPSEQKNLKDRFCSEETGKPFITRLGAPDPKKITTSRIERANLTLRISSKRFNRATICFSRCESNLHYAVMLFVAHYNFVKPHRSLGKKTTPAMASKICDKPWAVDDLLSWN